MSDTLTTTTAPDETDILRVIEGLEIPEGCVNVSDDTLHAHIRSALRRPHRQVRRMALQTDRVCLVGGGPSLNDTLPELVDLLHQGAKLVTVNGAYQWALERHLTPKTQIVMDARESNARFVDPALPRCNYVISSTCHPTLWDKLDDRPHVWMWHPVEKGSAMGAELDAYYGAGLWEWVGGGTTVITRALFALRLLGYTRFDLFGVDSCWLRGENHAYAQPENDGDHRYAVTVAPSGHPELKRQFTCAGWHLKQVEDVLRIMRVAGHQFLVNVHGDGLLAYVLQANADVLDLEQA